MAGPEAAWLQTGSGLVPRTHRDTLVGTHLASGWLCPKPRSVPQRSGLAEAALKSGVVAQASVLPAPGPGAGRWASGGRWARPVLQGHLTHLAELQMSQVSVSGGSWGWLSVSVALVPQVRCGVGVGGSVQIRDTCPAVAHTASPPYRRHASAHQQPRQRLPGPVRPALRWGRSRGHRARQSICQLPRQPVPTSFHDELPTRRLPGGDQGDNPTLVPSPACTHPPEDVPFRACLLRGACYQGGTSTPDHPPAAAGGPPAPASSGPSPTAVQLCPCVGLSQPSWRLLHR